jgi:DNA-binding CsgD family transcriptional regulator
MEQAFAEIVKADSVARAIEVARLRVQELGAVQATLHAGAPHVSQTGPQTYIAHFGKSDDWIAGYLDPAIRQYDPIPNFVMRLGHTIDVCDAIEKLSMTAEEAACVDRFYGDIKDNTVAIPAYGPFDFDNFATITLDHPIDSRDDALVRNLIGIVELLNRRVGQLLHTDSALEHDLSARELEVLNWIGQSKSNGDIATILSISPSTVDTYIRRVFAKLEVNDRISAAIKGVQLGLIRF